MKRVVLAVLVLVPVARAAPLVSHLRGADVVLESSNGDPCSGTLWSGPLPGTAPGLSPDGPVSGCPFTVPGDGAPDGSDFAGRWYLLGDPGSPGADDAAFRIERHFDVRADAAGRLLPNTYLVSVPMIPGTDDVANTAAPEADKCVGDPGGPAAGDGVTNADDLLCAWWTSRATGQGSMMISRRDEATASWQDRVALVDPATGEIQFDGAWTEPIDPHGEGYLVSVDGAAGTSNVALVGGGHDSSYPGRTISTASDQLFLLPLPAHGKYRAAEELLCGLKDTDWFDADGDGTPDTCPSGVFDGRHAVAVTMFDNDPASPRAGTYVTRVVTTFLGMRLIVAGTPFDLRPGDAVFVNITASQQPTTFLEPHE